jgi:hypothetical protein
VKTTVATLIGFALSISNRLRVTLAPTRDTFGVALQVLLPSSVIEEIVAPDWYISTSNTLLFLPVVAGKGKLGLVALSVATALEVAGQVAICTILLGNATGATSITSTIEVAQPVPVANVIVVELHEFIVAFES